MDLHQSKNGMFTSAQQCENFYYSYLFLANAMVNWTVLFVVLFVVFIFWAALPNMFKHLIESTDEKRIVPFITSTISAFWASFWWEDCSIPNTGLRPGPRLILMWNGPFTLCNIWLQIMKGTCKKKKERRSIISF